MYHITFDNTSFDTAILIKQSALAEDRMRKEYITPMANAGINVSGIVGFSLTYDKKKPSAKCRKEYLGQLLPELDKLGITTLICCDGEYFKTLTKNTKAEAHLGYVLPCAIKDFEHLNVVYGINYQNFFYNPDNRTKMDLAFKAYDDHMQGVYQALGENILTHYEVPETLEEIEAALEKLKEYPSLAMDIEAFDLKHYKAGIGTISFSWDEHSAIAFTVDAKACEPYEIEVWDKKDKKFKKRIAHIEQVRNEPVRALLKKFFTEYLGHMLWHNASFDVTVLIYQLWMEDLLDREGLLEGLEIMTKRVQCTQIITYLATNSCAGNELGLKAQAHEFAGNYAIEVTDIRLQPLPELLKYNAVDTCSTWFVMDKHYPTLVFDEQWDLYHNHFLNYLVDIIDTQLTGMCLDMVKVKEAEVALTDICDRNIRIFSSSSIVRQFFRDSIAQEVIDRNAAYKTKVIDETEARFKLNLNSNQQLQTILYDYMKLPVIDFTDSKQPAVGGKTLEKLLSHTDNQEYLDCIQAMIDFSTANKVLTSFVRNFLEAPLAKDGYHYLYGSFKLGGTVSGRLSSSNPNLQNIPSGSEFSKIIKACFVAPKGWVMVGLDYNSLEDYISALTTKDPMKLKVYLDGYCGHCLRAAYYFADEMPDIDPKSVESVNSIKKKYPKLRQKSKIPTFLLTYGGTWKGIVNSLGFSEKEAKRIEDNYHKLYRISDEWVSARVRQASSDGYVTCAFGLRVRTPLLNQVVLGARSTPQEAQGEARTAGNALGQSWGMLNSRASYEFMDKARNSLYREVIKPIGQIHDSQYFLIKDSFDILSYVNEHLVKAVQWQEDPAIAHDKVKLGGDLSIFYPNWGREIEIPNGLDAKGIKEVCLKVSRDEKMQKM